MDDITKVKVQIERLLKSSLGFEPERVSGGAADYQRLAPEWLERLKGISSLDAQAFHNDYSVVLKINYIREAIFRLCSLECAAGAPAERCRKWFQCLAVIDSHKLLEEMYPVNSEEAVSFFALARDFSLERYQGWPEKADYDGVSSSILYELMTGKIQDFHNVDAGFDDVHWLRLYEAIKARGVKNVQRASMELADYWYHDYEINEVPINDLARYPCFEPDCNAVLAIALYREKIPVIFNEEKYRRFYLAALL